MKAKNTVMSTEQYNALKLDFTTWGNVDKSVDKLLLAQAEISFKAGIREVVNLLTKVPPVNGRFDCTIPMVSGEILHLKGTGQLLFVSDNDWEVVVKILTSDENKTKSGG